MPGTTSTPSPGPSAGTRASPSALQVIGRELRVGLPLCVGVALFLTAVFGDPLGTNLVFSLCIGLSIQGLCESGRFGLAGWLRQRGGTAPALQAHWPGWHLMLPWMLLSIVAGYALGSTLATAITGHSHLLKLFSGNLRPLAVISFVVLTVTVGTTYSFYLRGRMVAFEAAVEASRRLAAEAQLKLLQSQLEPHMLFNTLANLRALIGVDPPRAQAMLDRIIDFLRATLSASRVGRHRLCDEFARLNDYLVLMQIRMGDRLKVELDLPAELADCAVPPLLLQPLVENAIKHGLEPQKRVGLLRVSAAVDGEDRLRLCVSDSGAGLTASAPRDSGFGLTQVRDRLSTLYGTRASLALEDRAEGGTLACVRLPREQLANDATH